MNFTRLKVLTMPMKFFIKAWLGVMDIRIPFYRKVLFGMIHMATGGGKFTNLLSGKKSDMGLREIGLPAKKVFIGHFDRDRHIHLDHFCKRLDVAAR